MNHEPQQLLSTKMHLVCKIFAKSAQPANDAAMAQVADVGKSQ